MSEIKTILKRELKAYLFSPISFIFVVIFITTSMGLTFVLGHFYESNNSSLETFFNFLPWVYLFLIPAIGMRLWAEEKREGTFEVLSTLPFELWHLVVGKFLASWLFIGVCLLLTFPLIVTVYYLGSPDFGPLFAGYLGSWLMAGAFLAITSLTSALTQNQIISFVVAVMACLMFDLIGFGVFQTYMSFLPTTISEFIANMGFIPHFHSFTNGVIDSKDVIYFVTFISFFLILNSRALQQSTTR